MPITTTSELMSASNWYPSPPVLNPTDLLDDLADFQQISWTYRSLLLSVGGYVHAMLMITVQGQITYEVLLTSAPIFWEILSPNAPVTWEVVSPNAPITSEVTVGV